MNNVEGLRVFLEVVRQGSFAEAARHLNQPTTTISRKIKQLEAELGAQLIHRTTRSQSLTSAGEALLPKAEAALASLQELTDEITQHTRAPSGILNISGPPTILQNFAPVFAAFSAKYPEIRIHFESSSRYQNLIESRLDFAFRVGPLSDSSMIARKVATISNCLVSSPEYLNKIRVPAHPKELEGLQRIHAHIDGLISPWRFEKGKQTYRLDRDGHFNSDDLTLCLQLAKLGLGIAYLPTSMVQPYLEAHSLSPVLQDWMPSSRDLFLVYQDKSYLAPKSRAFIEFMIDQIR